MFKYIKSTNLHMINFMNVVKNYNSSNIFLRLYINTLNNIVNFPNYISVPCSSIICLINILDVKRKLRL